MPTNVNGVTGGGSAADATSAALKNNTVSTDQFLKLLVMQLKSQDPLNPLSNEDFLSQLAQFQSLEETMETATNTKNLLLGQQLAAASNLIGKSVVAVQGGEQLSGRVDKVVISNGQVKVVVDGAEVSLDEITEVCIPDATDKEVK